MADCCSGLIELGMEMTGFKMVFLSSTKIGITPYILIGRSLIVWACGCSKLTFTYTLGDISFSALNLTIVCPCCVSTQNDLSTLLPDSMLINPLPPLLLGIVILTSSSTLYFSLFDVNDNIDAAVGSSVFFLLCQPGSSM